MQLKKRHLPLFLIIKMKSIKATKRIKRTERTKRTKRTKRIKTLKTAAPIILTLTLLTISILSAPGFDVYAESMPGAAGAVQPRFAYSSMEVLAKNGDLAKNGEALDLRAAAGQSLYGYDTLQGACANGGCAYYTLFNRNKNKCRIVRLDLASLNVIQVSAPLKLYHANNLTFNTKKNLLVATCCQVKGKRVVFIDPVTLTVVSKKDIKLKASKSIPKTVVRKYNGFTAIAYNEKYDCYVGRLRGNNNVIIFDGELKPVRYVKLRGKRTGLLNQGMESAGDYIYDVRSFKGKRKYSMVTIHDMSGAYAGAMKFAFGKKPGEELQCIFNDGDRFYAGFYYTTSQKHDDKKHHVKRYNRIYALKTAN